MKKICHVTSVHSSDDIRVFHKECVSLARAGYEVYLVAPGEDREEKGVHVVGIGPKPQGTVNRLRANLGKKAYFRALSLDAEIYHLHDPELLPWALALAKKGKRVIFDSHEFFERLIYERHYVPRALRAPAARVFHAYETHVLRHLDAVITPCTLDGVNVFEGRAKRTVFIDNLPPAEQFPGPGEPSPDSENTVGYAGGITGARGITNLVMACHAAGAKLRLAGPVWHTYREELEAMPEYECVTYEGVLPYTEIPGFCRRIRVGMCLLRNIGQYASLDNLPTKVYEYMGSGLPVILSDTRSARRLAEKYDCCVCVDPEDIGAVAAAIRALLDDPERARQMGERGYRAVKETYSWANEEKKLLALYKELSE